MPGKPSWLKRFYNPISRRGMLQIYQRQEKFYLGMCILSASIGYLFLLFFPVTTLIMLDMFQGGLSTENTLIQWLFTSLYLIIGLIAAYYSFVIFRLKFSLPSGYELEREKFPLFEPALHELESEFGNIKIHRYVLTMDNDIQAVKTPRFGYPFLARNSIKIGLTTMLSQPALYFRVQLARSIGLVAGKHNRITGWAYFSTQYWLLYYRAFRQSSLPFSTWPGYFFKVYAPFNESFCIGLKRHIEKEADRYAMEVFNHEDVIQAMVYSIASQYFLDTKFWPQMIQATMHSEKSSPLPYSNMSKVISNNLKPEVLAGLSRLIITLEDDYSSALPLAEERLLNLGYDSPLTPVSMTKSAANEFLSSVLQQILPVFEKQWFMKQKKQQKK